jgi:hypothetical protein
VPSKIDSKSTLRQQTRNLAATVEKRGPAQFVPVLDGGVAGV